MFVYVCVFMVEENSVGSFLLSIGSRAWILIIRLGSKYFYLIIHVISILYLIYELCIISQQTEQLQQNLEYTYLYVDNRQSCSVYL